VAKTFVLWNSEASQAERYHSLMASLRKSPDVDVRLSGDRDSVPQLVAEAAGAGYERVVAAGGDGTVHAAVNAMLDNNFDVPLAILPLGTANDISSTLGIPADPEQAAQLLHSGRDRRIDLAHFATAGHSHYFCNVATGGNADRVQEAIDEEMKQRMGAWCYLRGAISVLADLQGYDVTLRFDQGEAWQQNVWNILVCNGRYAGGLEVAAQASPDDGLLEVIVVLSGSPLELASMAADFFLGNYLENERVLHTRTGKVRIHSAGPIRFSVDGEAVNVKEVTFTVRPQALTVRVPSE
jgi:diacylglycerol kinase (ATP)